MKRGWMIGSLLGLIAVSLLGFLIWKTKGVGHETYNRNVGYIRHLQRLDAAWTVEVMKSQLALTQSYDNVASYLPEIRALRAKLQTSELADERVSPVIAEQLAEYLSLMAEKEDRIERFKSGLAIVRNSTRYLPQAGEAVIETASANNMTAFARDVQLNLKDIYAYLMAPDEAKRQALAEALQIEVMAYPKNVADPAANFLSHANLILEQKEPTDSLLASVVEVPSSKAATNVLDLYGELHGQRVAQASRYQVYLFVYAGVLLLGSFLIAMRLVRAYGSERENLALATANRDLEEKVAVRTRELEDAVRQLKGSQAQLVHAGRMAAVGQLVAGVAHEVNTPLGYLRGNVETLNDLVTDYDELTRESESLRTLLQSEGTADDQIAAQMNKVNELAHQLQEGDVGRDARQLLSDMDYGISQITLIVKNLKDFSRVDRAMQEKVDLNEIVENTLRVSHHLVKKHAEIAKQLQPLPKVTCAPSQINQVLLNLLTNATHAIEQKGIRGKIHVRTRVDKNWACILVKDNGVGMDKGTADNIFEPFFTTKEMGKGTGLGLSICQNIIKEHGGHLAFKSEAGKGTAFQIALPLEAKAKAVGG